MTTEARIRKLLEAHIEPPAGLDEPLELESLELVMVTEALEDEFNLRVRATDVVPANFGTLRALIAFVERSAT
jgi:acyl carrier protein